MCACTEPAKKGIGAVCVECGRSKWPITILNHTNKHAYIQNNVLFLIFGNLCSYDPLWRVFFAWRQKTVSVASLPRLCPIITQIRGHIEGSSPPSPLQFVPACPEYETWRNYEYDNMYEKFSFHSWNRIGVPEIKNKTRSHKWKKKPTRGFANTRTCLMYHAAGKVELQRFKRLYSQLTFFHFL